MIMRKALVLSVVVIGLAVSAFASEIHVALQGRDSNPGTPAAPLRTIQRAADLALPGDVITVHAGVYRERIVPPRGGNSDAERIVYQAAPGEKVEIAGSEIVKGWVKGRAIPGRSGFRTPFSGRSTRIGRSSAAIGSRRPPRTGSTIGAASTSTAIG